jgi:hypothetical protein
LVPLDMDSHVLIDKAQVVSTINGSIGWEALSLYNKPIMIFGNIWYGRCNSCFTVSSCEELKDALVKIKSIDKDAVKRDVLDLLLFYNNKFALSSDGEFYASYSKVERGTLIENLVTSLMEKLNEKDNN